MRLFLALVFWLVFLSPATLPDARTETSTETKDLRNHPFSVDFPSGGQLRLYLRSGASSIVGTDAGKLSVRFQGKNAYKAQDLTVRLKRLDDHSAELHVFGGPKNDLEVTVEVPKTSGIFVRMGAGELSVNDVSGDKDIELHAGDLSIAVGSASDYAQVDASVTAGNLDAAPFGESHGGLFRSFEKSGAGKHKLHAHLGAGNLELH
ncbi:MAG TPA: hypothetical protein VOA64_00695 [Candidatus Dormibacteraeota bacterium]|nr:hypothetical protein [Candidatus Dormibacteraeota bacterium]